MALHVIVGKGPIGSHTAQLLLAQGHTVRVVSRSGGTSDSVEHVRADASSVEDLRVATGGAAAIYNTANPSYARWSTDWPPVAASLLAAAEASGAVLVMMGNLYPYGPVSVPMTESLPDAATDAKGRIRAGMWADALALHRVGRIRTVEARASDCYGPGVTTTGHLAGRVVPRLLAGKSASIIGDPDNRHSFSFVPDVARTLVTLGQEERAWGRTWHVPSAPALTRREAIAGLAAAAGVEAPKVQSMPWSMVRAIGLVQPELRELYASRYQWQHDYVLDSSAFTAEFGQEATPLTDGFAETVDFWRKRG